MENYLVDNWQYVVGFFALVFYGWFCYRIGKSDAQEKFLESQKQAEQSRLWMDMLKNMGGKNE